MSEICAHCKGSGWLVVEKDGISAADRCPCSAPRGRELVASSKPSASQLGAVVEEFAKTIPFFPQDNAAWFLIVEDMATYVTDLAALELFRVNVFRLAKKYEGPAGLRQMYEALVDSDSTDRAQGERQRREIEETDRRMLQYRREHREAQKKALLAPEANAAPPLLEQDILAAKVIPPPRLRSKEQPEYSYNRLAEAAKIARSLAEREKDLLEAARRTPVRSEEERARLAREIAEKVGLRHAIENGANGAGAVDG